ncbi:MAG: hypothetical protein HQ559_01045 [Lentisphaerae bacterium]|nr:hypothetical protein [Lentisphaerota bacterium]
MINPYRDSRGDWVRGNFHGHCCEHSGCSTVPLMEGVRRYSELGARFMAVTDHDHVTDLSAAREAHPDMVFLEGLEHSWRENILFVGEHVPPLEQVSLEEAMARSEDQLTIVCHPDTMGDGQYWTEEKLLALGRMPDGIEVYNGHYGIGWLRSVGTSPLYTHCWDALLTAGHHIWGFADDDFHGIEDFDRAFNMVRVEEVTAEAIIRSAKQGQCYGSTGLLLEAIEERDGVLQVSVQSPCTGKFIGPGGTVLQEGQGNEFEYVPAGEAYVRFEAEGEAGQLWLQPMWNV